MGAASHTWVGVFVTDENDCAPEWIGTYFEGIVEEGVAPGSIVLVKEASHPQPLTVMATDCDEGANGRVTYHQSLTHQSAAMFRVNKHTGKMDETVIAH